MPQINITTNEILSGGGVPTGTGAAFVAGAADQGPPPNGPAYVACQSLRDYISAFGQRSATSATLYDWVEEFFADGGTVCYVARANDGSATTASGQLTDPAGAGSVTVAAQTSGAAGNLTAVQVTQQAGPAFTASAGANQNVLSNVSSYASVGVGTPVSGAGIPVGTYVTAVAPSPSAQITLSNPVASGNLALQVTPTLFTVSVQSPAGTPLEVHGPYSTTAQLVADTTSGLVSFSAGASPRAPSGPAAATSLTGGANSVTLTDASHVAALAVFPPQLGAGTVALPGKTSVTAWQGLLSHANANNRFAILDMVDSPTSNGAIAQAQSLGTNSNASWGMFIQGSLILPGIAPNTTRIVPGSSLVAALRARVAATNNNNRAPAGQRWAAHRPVGFTQFFGPTPVGGGTVGQFQQSDVNAMEAAGVNCFANYYGTLCLFGFVTPVPKAADAIYWQATASCERMNLVALAQAAMAPYLFDPLDGTGVTITAVNGDLQAILQNEWLNGALYGATPQEAGTVITDPPVNTPATAQAGQLNAQINARISPYVDAVNITITVYPLTQSIPQPLSLS